MPSEKVVRAAKWGAIPAAVLLSSAMVWQASYSAFSATTENAGNEWAAGSLTISDDDRATYMFHASGLKPGESGEKCINVKTAASNVTSTVKLYGQGYTSPGTSGLGDKLDLVIQRGTGGSFADCTGFTPDAEQASFTGTLKAFSLAHTAWTNGWAPWVSEGGAERNRTYKISYTFNSSADNTYQGGSASIDFKWEAQTVAQ